MRRMSVIAIVALIALASCATRPSIEEAVEGAPAGSFAVRYDQAHTTPAEADDTARAHCGGGAVTLLGEETRRNTRTYRSYRCGEA